MAGVVVGGRYTLQELFGWNGAVGAIAATALTLLLPVAFILAADEGSYRMFWTLFGTSNQLLAALTFLAVSVWLRRSGRAYWFTLVPMVFVMSITLYSLAIQASNAFAALRSAETAIGAATVNGGVALVLILLAGVAIMFLGGLLSAADLRECLIVVASDHGNVEDCSQGKHTLNPALCMLIGNRDGVAVDAMQSLYDLAPAILRVLAVEGE